MNPANEYILKLPTNAVRAFGLIPFVIGALLLTFCEVIPLQDAIHHAHDLGGKFSGKGVMVGFVGCIIGLATIIGGAPVVRFLNPKTKGGQVGVVILGILICGGGLAIYFVTKSYMESLGYVFRYY